MKKSRYFSDLLRNYNDEVDDLVTDSGGKSVLQKRLNDKRREIDAILPMIGFSPEMVSVVFYGAFGFTSPEIMQRIVLSEPGRSGFLAWSTLKKQLAVTDWALPLVAASLKTQGGDAFLVATAALEFLRLNDSSDAPALEQLEEKERGEDGDEGDEGDGTNDLSEAQTS
ncbi:hypothetical protein [Propionivibrio sp.]|uniref:hypothetical protein n=1 Tax=Propionivibrio sp. TaxID=2212460 RepID=UPI003BF3A188